MAKFFASPVFKTILTAVIGAALTAIAPVIIPSLPAIVQPIVAGAFSALTLHFTPPKAAGAGA